MRGPASLLAIIFVAASGFQIPEDSANGVYIVAIDAEGNEQHTLLDRPLEQTTPDDTSSASPQGPKLLSSDDKTRTLCWMTKDLNHADLDSANHDLDQQCNAMNAEVPVGAIAAGLSIYALHNGVVAYFCNYNAGPDRCDSGTRAASSAMITESCGWYNSGEVLTSGNIDHAYGSDISSARFCGTGVGTRH